MEQEQSEGPQEQSSKTPQEHLPQEAWERLLARWDFGELPADLRAQVEPQELQVPLEEQRQAKLESLQEQLRLPEQEQTEWDQERRELQRYWVQSRPLVWEQPSRERSFPRWLSGPVLLLRVLRHADPRRARR